MNKNLQKLKNKYILFLIISIILSILSVASIPAIIFGAIHSIIALLIIGIVFAVHAFYGLIFWWTYVINLKQRYLILTLIEQQNYYYVKEIAIQTNTSEENIKNIINWLIAKQYLTNYFFDGNCLKLNNRTKQNLQNNLQKCPCCGSNMTKKGEKTSCDYCGYNK